jgi:tetratricopeptide (TPR) repeat protein
MPKRNKSRRTPVGRAAAVAEVSAPPAPEAGGAKGAREAAPARRPLLWPALSALLVLVVFLLYANSLGNQFVFDDIDLLADPNIKKPVGWGVFISDSYRPLRTISYALDYALWGLNPVGFRLTNIAVHAVNCVLALFVARRVVGGATLPALAAALVFAVHPAQVESVAYISGRRDVLFTLFYLAAFLCYTRFSEAQTARARVGWLAGAGVGFVLSLMSKEMAASLPLVCLLWDVFRATAPSEAGERPRLVDSLTRLARERAPVYGAASVALLAFAYYTLFVRDATSRVRSGGDVEFWGGSLLNNLLTVPLTYAHYAKVAVWPQTLAAQYYGAFAPASGIGDPRVIPALLFVLGLAAAAGYLILRTSHREAGFGIAWFLLAVLPASQIIPHHEIVADHYLYLPLVGVGLVAAGGLQAIRSAGWPAVWRRAAYGAALVVLLALCARTILRNFDWRDQLSLWTATYAAVPDSPRASYNLGLEMTRQGEHRRAIELYKEAIAADPEWFPAHRNLASSYAVLGRYDEAKQAYKAALKMDLEAAARRWHTRPDYLRGALETEIAILDWRLGNTAAARDALAAVIAWNPDFVRAQDVYAGVLADRGELDATIEQYRQRVAAEPDNPSLRLTLAGLLWGANLQDEAYEHLTYVLPRKPDSCMAHLLLGMYYGQFRPNRAPSPETAEIYLDAADRFAPSYMDLEFVQRKRAEALRAPVR